MIPFQRTRLAPSPTGALHLGHARTFLIAWGMARQAGAKIFMRMEDLDEGRARPESIEQAYADLRWLGMAWDVMGTGRMVLRAGFGMFYNEYPSQMFVPNGAGTPGLQNMPTGWNMVGPSGAVTTPGGNINLGAGSGSTPAAVLPNLPVFGSLTTPGLTGSCTVRK